jgi:cell division protein FtsL
VKARFFLIRITLCLISAFAILFFYIDENNDLTELRKSLPSLEKEVKALREENIRLQYEIDRFESPENLFEMAKKPQFSHLRYPYSENVIILKEP